MQLNPSWSNANDGAKGHHARQSETVLSLEDVTKEFPGVKALDHVRFTLRRGEVHAVCGKNGAGKPCPRQSIRRRNHDLDLLVKFREAA
jgi:ABC-type molybdenum transport system ATPase subunit/photorepair protein PhrA